MEPNYEKDLEMLFVTLEANYPYYEWKMISDWWDGCGKVHPAQYLKPYIGTKSIPNDIKIEINYSLISNGNYEPRWYIGSNKESYCYSYSIHLDLLSFIIYLKRILPTQFIEQPTLF